MRDGNNNGRPLPLVVMFCVVLAGVRILCRYLSDNRYDDAGMIMADVCCSWQRCFAGSCVASVKPDAGSLAILRAETERQLRFLDATGNTVAIPLSWNGLDQALSALEKAK